MLLTGWMSEAWLLVTYGVRYDCHNHMRPRFEPTGHSYDWVAVNELNLSYRNPKTILFGIYTNNGDVI